MSVKYDDLLHMIQFRLWKKYGYNVNRAFTEINEILEQKEKHVARQVFEEIMMFDVTGEIAPQRGSLEIIAGALEIPVNDPKGMQKYAREYVRELSGVYAQNLDGEDKVFDLGSIIRSFGGPLPDKGAKDNKIRQGEKYPASKSEKFLTAADETAANGHEYGTEEP